MRLSKLFFIVWEFHTCIEYVLVKYTPIPCLLLHLSLPSSISLARMFFKDPSSLCVRGCRGFYWSIKSWSWPPSPKTTHFPSPRSHQQPTASHLGGGISWVSFQSMLGFLTGLILCRSCPCSHSHCVFTCAMALLCRLDTVFLQTSTASGSCHFSTLSSVMSLSGKGCDIDVSFRAEHSAFSCFLSIGHLWVSVYISIYSKMKLLGGVMGGCSLVWAPEKLAWKPLSPTQEWSSHTILMDNTQRAPYLAIKIQCSLLFCLQ